MEKISRIRIGIDVGGTFTDAVAIDNETYELIGAVKIPTTHSAEDGVAAGIVKVLYKLMQEYNIHAEDVCFIAHGTTQATNALLEGDVAKVGIVTLGAGLEGLKAKADTNMGEIVLSAGKNLSTYNTYINMSDSEHFQENIIAAVEELKEKGAVSFVATEAFSVDNPQNEQRVIDYCFEHGLPATAGNDVSKLYGLKVRTRTAVVNASILPKMLEAANMTERSIKKAKISSPLMVMRCDGGVMTVEEVRRRPILTILSGPAAGVAGALMYEKLTDGIFLEVGGTSTDISCVKDGRVMVRYAEVGGHKTYLNSLDVRTVGIGGGSMIQTSGGNIVGVGPRSAHIAGLEYECFADENDIVQPQLTYLVPETGDSEYAVITCANGKQYALTLSGAANIAGFVKEGDYSFGNLNAAVKAWKPLADSMNLSVEDCAKHVMNLSVEKNKNVILSLVKDYNLTKETLVFVGGGGGASSVVPKLAESMGNEYKIAANASVLSPIGVALAMIRDMVERVCVKPTEEDLVLIRREAYKRAITAGAAPESIVVKVEVDAQENKIRATAMGTIEMRSKDLTKNKLQNEELVRIAAENMKIDVSKVRVDAENSFYVVAGADIEKKYLFVLKKKLHSIRLIDRTGVVRMQRLNAGVEEYLVADWRKGISRLLEEYSEVNDGGEALPNIYIVYESQLIEICGMQNHSQVYALAAVELESAKPEDKLIMIATLATENQRG